MCFVKKRCQKQKEEESTFTFYKMILILNKVLFFFLDRLLTGVKKVILCSPVCSLVTPTNLQNQLLQSMSNKFNHT